MKTRLMILAALAAASASAQTLKADIPFTFQTAGATLPPGAYVVTVAQTTGRQLILMRNADTGDSVLLAQFTDAVAPASMRSDAARLRFACAGRACVLRQMWKGGGSGGYEFLGPKLRPGEDARIAEVALVPIKAD